MFPLDHIGREGVLHEYHPLLGVALVGFLPALQHVLGNAGEAADLLHAEGPALDVLGVGLLQPDGRVLIASGQHRHLEGVVSIGVIAGELLLDPFPVLPVQVCVHLHDAGDHGAVLVELPPVLLGRALRSDGLSGQV